MSYKYRSGLRSGSTKRLMIGPGALYKNFDLSAFKVNDESTWGELLGATKGGNEVNMDIEYHVAEIDGTLGPVEGAEWLIKAVAKVSTNLLEISRDNLLLKLPSFNAQTHDTDYDIIKHNGEIAPTSAQNLALVGEITGKSIPVIIVLERARCIDAFNLPFGTGKDDVVLKAEFESRYTEDAPTTIPFYILYPKGGSPVAMPTANPTGGTTHTTSVDVELLHTDPTAEIYYTTDGSIPTPSTGTLYSGTPINLTATATIKAIAVVGADTSMVASFLYTVNP
ncbi:chitobiase/beta-hexosaminidase C-terminal domain-containing protein [Bacillus tianshenii]|nr:chitobiase/beta-hexosaminidase C-terminal domain-containing protein [Bacillus tianshenii]